MNFQQGEVLLEARDVKKNFEIGREGFIFTKPLYFKAVQGISLKVFKGETLAIVGESGCGKSTFGRVLMNLISPSSGEVLFRNQRIDALKGVERKDFCKKVQMIFQDPFATLNPRMTIFDAVSEPLVIHNMGTPSEIEKRVYSLIEKVGLRKDQAHRYPHEFSGGQRQRIAIARALALNPEVIIGDEPVSALDVSIQSQVINLLNDLKEELGLTLIFISHDLSVVRHIADRVAVMNAGRVVELGLTEEVFSAPKHEYTQKLLSSAPGMYREDRKISEALKQRLALTQAC